MDDNYIIRILNSRENRFLRQEDILSKYPFSLISFTLNIPGKTKDNCLIRRMHNEGVKAITTRLSKNYIKYKEIRYLDTGPEAFISIDMHPFKLKDIVVHIEESHTLGRLFDIDVFDINHLQVSRSNMDKEPRRCLICDDLAIDCIKTTKHSYEELIRKIEDMCKFYEW